MLRIATIILLQALFLGRSALAESPAPEKPAPLEFGVWKIPLTAVTVIDRTQSSHPRQPKPGFKTREGSSQLDATGFVRALGIPEIAGFEAIYDPAQETLVVKNTKKNLERFSLALSCSGVADAALQIASEFSAFELQRPPSSNGASRNAPTWSDVTDAASSDRRLLGRVSGLSMPGRSTTLTQTVSPGGPDADSGKPKPAASGQDNSEIAVELKTGAGTDAKKIESEVAFRWKGTGADGKPSAVEFEQKFVCLEETPMVLQASNKGRPPGSYLVVTGVHRIVCPFDWTLETLADAANTARRIEEATITNSWTNDLSEQ